MSRRQDYNACIDSVKSYLKEKAKLAKFLDDYLDDDPRPKHKVVDMYPKTKFKSKFTASIVSNPSGKSFCGNFTVGCARKMFYKVTGAPKLKIIPASLRKRFDAGSAIHEMFQKYLLDLCSIKSYPMYNGTAEYEIVPEMGGEIEKYSVLGKVDFHYYVSEWPYIVELKTDAEKTFEKRTRPNDAHITQVNMYMALLDIPIANIMYIGFSPEMPIKEYIIEYDDDRWQACKGKMDYVLSCPKKKKIPDREGGVWICRNCEYKHICKPPEINTETELL